MIAAFAKAPACQGEFTSGLLFEVVRKTRREVTRKVERELRITRIQRIHSS